jgi:hypothetical protein
LVTEEVLMLQLASLLLYPVKRILEGDLLLGQGM